MSKMIRGQYRGRNRKQHYDWIRENADYFSVYVYQLRKSFKAESLDQAKEIAVQMMTGLERVIQPAMIYAVKDIHSTMIITYHPVSGFKEIKN